MRGSPGRHANVNDVALVLHPESPVGRAADLLHDRSASRARRQSGATGWLVVRQRRTRQRHVAELAILLHGLQRSSIDEHHAASPEVRPHVDSFRVEPGPVAGHVDHGKGVVGVGEQRARQRVLPDAHAFLDAATHGFGARLPSIAQDFRRLHDDHGTRRRLVADHLVRAEPPRAGRTTLPVRAGRDHHAFARLQDLGRLADGAKWPLLACRVRGRHSSVSRRRRSRSC